MTILAFFAGFALGFGLTATIVFHTWYARAIKVSARRELDTFTLEEGRYTEAMSRLTREAPRAGQQGAHSG